MIVGAFEEKYAGRNLKYQNEDKKITVEGETEEILQSSVV